MIERAYVKKGHGYDKRMKEIQDFVNVLGVKKQEIYKYIDSTSSDAKGLIKFDINDAVTYLE